MRNSTLNLWASGESELLTRDQMKNVFGGYVQPPDNVQCNFYSTGTGSCAAADDMPSNCGDLDACQDKADSICEKYDCCDDSTCKYA
ncbi:hypothetical protein ACFGVS_20490 [Mucilaginibacter sp. AW1-7]|jgi:hypothetical protein|uniref:hypothetical protein n=1 Tax=unclassified Mucilaginibacter TaxID=2617802 RepID=UPI0008BA858B|nr:hypothetical protein [Mucilaginibacter sp. OK283]SEP24395.1 hypothetical protein SAMN05428947_10947 [Mucilaginibacter sp. OK283]